MPQGSTTTARHPGARSAPFRFDTLTHAPRPPVEYAGLTSPALPEKQHVTAGDYNACPPQLQRRWDDSRYAEWQQVNGSVVPTRVALSTSLSELFSAYNLTLDADRVSSAATSSALSLAATDLEYEGTRVKSAVIGRDLNPFGRGDGRYYANGGNPIGRKFFVYDAKPPLPIARSGFGSSVNNCGGSCGAGAGGVGIAPGGFPGGYPPNQNGYHGGQISYGGGGGTGFSSFGCNVVRNRLIGSTCPTIGSYCTHEFCQEAGQPKWAFSCFDSCTHHQCDDLVNLLWQDGVDWASCEWHGGVEWDSPATVAVFAQVACGGGGVIRDCLCNGMCLDFCIQLVGGKPCYPFDTCIIDDPSEYTPSGRGHQGQTACGGAEWWVNYYRGMAIDCVQCWIEEGNEEDSATLGRCVIDALLRTKYYCYGCCPPPDARTCCIGQVAEQCVRGSWWYGRPMVLLCELWFAGGQDYPIGFAECGMTKTLIHEALHFCGFSDKNSEADWKAMDILEFCRPYCGAARGR